MKNNKGHLPMVEHYTFEGITDIGEVNGLVTCDNYGAPLRYVATLTDSQGKRYTVGTECAKTLSEAAITNEYSMNLAFKEFKKIATARNFLEKGKDVKIFHSYKEYEDMIIIGISGSKPKKIYVERKFDVFKDEYLSFIDDFMRQTKQNYPISEWTCWNDLFNYYDDLCFPNRKKRYSYY